MEELYSKSHLPKFSNDRRGSIFRTSLAEKDYLFVQMSKRSLRGGHYHNVETFHLVVQGRIRFELVDSVTREKRQLTAVPMDIIRVKAGVAHLLEALEDSMFIEPLRKHGSTVDFEPQRARVIRFLRSAQ
jgi:dTDP-4-dehydrorhamnose 3,5-epimerase-like enzyme